MKVGITISLYQNSFFASGVNQNALYLALVLKEGGHQVTLIYTEDDTVIEKSREQFYYLCDMHGLKREPSTTAPDKYFNVIIALGFWINNMTMRRYRTKSKKVKMVSYKCGNDFLVDSEHILFGQYKGRYDNISTDYELSRTPDDQLWMIPQMENISKDWYIFKSGTKNSTVVPFIWDHIAIDMDCKERGYTTYQKRDIKIAATMESNLSVMKYFLPTLVTSEELLNRGLIEKHRVMCADDFKDNKSLIKMISHTSLYKKGAISVNGRFTTPQMINEYCDIILSWQWENPLNYLYLDAVWMGAPVVHNAHLCKDIGYYYKDFKLYEAADVAEQAIKEHPTDEDYMDRNREKIKRYTRYNPKLVEQYTMLLENVVADKFVDMQYHWEDNSVSPK